MKDNTNNLENFIPKNSIYKYFIDGTWKESSTKKLIDIISPVDNSLLGKVQAINEDEASNLIESSFKTFESWKNTTVDSRADILRKAAKIMEENVELIVDMIIKEIGKPYKDSLDEVNRTVKLIEYYAEEGRRIHNDTLYSDSFPGYPDKKIAITKRVPLGVILAIPPFNYPINEGAPKIVGALIAGNTVVLKPSIAGILSSLLMVECFRLAGLPAGVLNVATGKSNEIGDVMVKNNKIAAINFTGSTKTALRIRDLMGMVPLLAGLGGKDASIVLKDADMKLAVSEIAKGAFNYSGQRCTGIKRVLVEENIYDSFKKEFKDYVGKNYSLKDPKEKDCTQGPVINLATVKLLDELLDDASKKGATLVYNEKKNSDNPLYYPCVIIENATTEMRVAWEEPFGPILPIIKVKNKEEAIEIANKSEYGLQSSVFTKNIDDAFYISEKLEVGTVQINAKDSRGPDHFPFIGVKASGMGQVQGAKYLIESMTRIKTIVLNKNY